ncbi:MAG: hypothetical protein WCP52_05220 [Bacteroidota bacterium]
MVLLIAANGIYGQTLKTTIGDDSPNGDFLLLMNNGSVVYETYTKKESFPAITIFDADLKKIAEKELVYTSKALSEYNRNKRKKTYLRKAFAINNKIVLFISFYDEGEKSSSLGRVIVNPLTAEIEKEDVLFTMNRGYESDAELKGIDNPDILFSKDDNSDYYAIIKYVHQKKSYGNGKNYEIFHYSPEHKDITNINFEYVNKKYECARPLSLLVFADKYLIISSFAFNSEKQGTIGNKFVISKLEKGTKTFIHKEIDYQNNYKTDKCLMQWNEKNKIIEALVYTQVGKDKVAFMTGLNTYLALIFQNIEPEKLELTKPYELPYNMLNEYVTKRVEKKKGYDKSMIDNFQIESNGKNLALLAPQNGLHGLVEFDVNGKELNAWAYPNTFVSFFPVTNSKGVFAIIDEMETNMETPINNKFDSYDNARSRSPVLLTLKENGDVLKEYIFGKPERKKYSEFAVKYYDKKSNTIVGILYSGQNDIKVGLDRHSRGETIEKLVKISFK